MTDAPTDHIGRPLITVDRLIEELTRLRDQHGGNHPVYVLVDSSDTVHPLDPAPDMPVAEWSSHWEEGPYGGSDWYGPGVVLNVNN